MLRRAIPLLLLIAFASTGATAQPLRVGRILMASPDFAFVATTQAF